MRRPRRWAYWSLVFALSGPVVAGIVHVVLGQSPFGSDLFENLCIGEDCPPPSGPPRPAPHIGAWARPYVGWRVAMVPDVMADYSLRKSVLLLIPVMGWMTALCVKKRWRLGLWAIAFVPVVWEFCAAVTFFDGPSWTDSLAGWWLMPEVYWRGSLYAAVAMVAGFVVPAFLSGLLVSRLALHELDARLAGSPR